MNIMKKAACGSVKRRATSSVSSAPTQTRVVRVGAVEADRKAPAGGNGASRSSSSSSSSRSSGGGSSSRRPQSQANRPLVPPFEAQKLAEQLFGAPQAKPALAALFDMQANVAGPRLYKPNLDELVAAGGASTADIPSQAAQDPTAPAEQLPLLVYLPGIDGTGLAAWRQFPTLSVNFDLRALYIPPEDRTGFQTLVKKVKALLRKEVEASGPNRSIYLMGESFGGLVALALASEMPDIDRVILVNPATGFLESAWPRLGPLLTTLPDSLYKALPIALSPLIGNPIAMAMHGVRTSQDLPNRASDFAYSLLDLIPELSMLRLVLPPATLNWRLRLLSQGAEVVNKLLRKVPQRTLLLVGELDLIVPNRDESERLQKTLPRCQVRKMPGRTHAMLQEAGVELMTILYEEGFYVTKRRLSNQRKKVGHHSHIKTGHDNNDNCGTGTSTSTFTSASVTAATDSDTDSKLATEAAGAQQSTVSPTSSSSSSALSSSHTNESVSDEEGGSKREKRKPSGWAFGTSGPIEKPTRRELEIASEAANLRLLRALVSPVYWSTGEDGVMQRGLDGVPLDGRPVLFVGNHQLFAPDMPLMIEDFLKQKDTMLRGLAHPFALSTNDKGEGAPFGRFLETFGAAPVNGPNMYKLLAQGDAVLLYPGGAREALKLKGEDYQIMWPETQEFVRMAARFNAVIVPFAAVGAEDGVTQVFDSKEMMELPIVGEYLKSQLPSNIPQARTGVNAGRVDQENWVFPLISFKTPARFYFKFQQPIATSTSMLKDKELAQNAYLKIRSEVKDGISWLLEMREQDPYKDLTERLLYEAVNGKQAPTFDA